MRLHCPTQTELAALELLDISKRGFVLSVHSCRYKTKVLISYCTADLRLCVRIGNTPFSHDAAQS